MMAGPNRFSISLKMPGNLRRTNNRENTVRWWITIEYAEIGKLGSRTLWQSRKRVANRTGVRTVTFGESRKTKVPQTKQTDVNISVQIINCLSSSLCARDARGDEGFH